MKKIFSVVMTLVLMFGVSASNIIAYANVDVSENQVIAKIVEEKNFTSKQIAQINKEINLMESNEVETDYITDIEYKDDKFIYIISNPGIDEKSYISIKEMNNGDVELDIREGSNHDIIKLTETDIYLDGKKVEISEAEEKTVSSDEIQPCSMYSWAQFKCPYGKASDYKKLDSQIKNSDIKMNKRLAKMTSNGLSTILKLALGSSLVGGIVGSLATEIISNAKIDNPNSKAISHITKRYKHYKKGLYVKPGMRVLKNKAKWYTRKNYKGRSHTKVTYSCYQYM